MNSKLQNPDNIELKLNVKSISSNKLIAEPKQLNNNNLLAELKSLVSEERKLLSLVLDYLSEVQSRKLYLKLGFPSLFEFCVKELGYSEGAAQRRISAMRLIKDIPEVKTKIESGKLNLTTLSQVSIFLKSEKKLNNSSYSLNATRELLVKLESKSKRECEKELFKLSPISALPKEKERQVSDNKTMVQVVIDEDLKAKLERIRALRSHKNVNLSYLELLKDMADIVLAKIDPLAKKPKTLPPLVAVENTVSTKPLNSRFIPAAIKRQVWQRDQGRCQYQSTNSEQKCNSTHFIQIDHIKPFSHGGSSIDINNLRLLCGNHNRYRWQKQT